MKGEIQLERKENWKNRIFLFCIGGRCMSGKIEAFVTTDEKKNRFQITVSFIEPSYFSKELGVGNTFTIQEASRIITIGKITSV